MSLARCCIGPSRFVRGTRPGGAGIRCRWTIVLQLPQYAGSPTHQERQLRASLVHTASRARRGPCRVSASLKARGAGGSLRDSQIYDPASTSLGPWARAPIANDASCRHGGSRQSSSRDCIRRFLPLGRRALDSEAQSQGGRLSATLGSKSLNDGSKTSPNALSR
jgi:hypothetical protein